MARLFSAINQYFSKYYTSLFL